MINKIKYTYILLFLFILNCGYQPIFQSKEINFTIGKIEYIGNEKLNRIIVKRLENYKEFDDNKKTLDLEINTNINKITSSKDTKGNPKTFRIELSTILKIYDSKKLIFTNNFLEFSNYNNMSSKFDLKNYENKIKNNLLEKVSGDIIIFLKTINI